MKGEWVQEAEDGEKTRKKKEKQTERGRRRKGSIKKSDRNLGYCLVQRRHHRQRGGSVLDVTAAGRNEDTGGLFCNGRPSSGQCSPFFPSFVLGSNYRERISRRLTAQFSVRKI